MNSLLIFLMFILISFYSSNFIILKLIGLLTILTIIWLLGKKILLQFIKYGIPHKKIFVILIFLIVITIISDLRSLLSGGKEVNLHIIPLVGAVVVIVYFLLNKRQNTIKKIENFNYFILVYLIIASLFFLVTDSAFYSFYFENPNAFGIFLFFLVYFQVYTMVFNFTKSFFNISVYFINFYLIFFFLLKSGARSIMLSLIVMTIVFVFWKLININRVVYHFSFLLFLSFIFTIILFILNIEYVTEYEILVFEVTGKRLSSGREEIWRSLLPYIEDNLLFGLGSNANPSSLLGVELSSHNLYIQLILESGLVYMSLFLILLIYIWNGFFIGSKVNAINARNKVLSATFLCGILVHQIFEVTLLQNNIGVSIIQWAFIMNGYNNINFFSKKGDMQ